MDNAPDALVSPGWLNRHLEDPDVVILDGSMKKTASGTLKEVESFRIKGAQQFDYETTICDQTSHLPHMMPPPEQFERQVRKLGVNHDSVIVVYDDRGVFASPRAWWMFKAMGHEKVAVLDGGLPLWKQLGYSLDKGTSPAPQEGDFRSRYQADSIFSKDDILRAINDKKITIIDSRSAGRFAGTEPEPREGLRKGHIPSSLNIPFTEVVMGGQLVSVEKLAHIFEPVITSPEEKQVYSCGSGVTACITALGAYLCGHRNLAIYDGSWTEWGAKSDLPPENRRRQ